MVSDNTICQVHDRVNLHGLNFQDINKQDLDVLEDNGRIIKITFNGKVYKVDDPARAPYNFIPLNHYVARPEETPILNKFHSNLLSGNIRFTITTKTPLFIRQEKESADFFREINGKAIVPGSSLRGLIRSMVEVLTWSEMDYVDKGKVLMHRAMADVSRLRQNYLDERPLMQNYKDEEVGLLKYDNGRYIIYQTDCIGRCQRKGNNLKYAFNDLENYWEVHPGPAPKKPNAPGNKGWKIKLPVSNDQQLVVPKNLIDSYQDDKNRPKKKNGQIIADILAMARTSTLFQERIFGKKPNQNILNQGVPVFFKTTGQGSNRVVTSIGHTRNYRIPYPYSIGDHLYQDKIDTGLDFAKTIFGNTSDISTRVFFDDAKLVERKDNEKDEVFTKLLLGPKPTTFQHYLAQPVGWKSEKSELESWADEDTQIRGYKQYWHKRAIDDPKDPNSWILMKGNKQKDSEKSGTDQQPIKAFKENVSFTSSIRFENLTSEELGALLFALDLPTGCYHKLGMGKPLGLGSVHIQIKKLNILKRSERYANVFGEDGKWNTGEVMAAGQMDDYKEAFEKLMIEQLRDSEEIGEEIKSLWDVDRLKELKTMLTFDHRMIGAKVDWQSRTRYMDIRHPIYKNEFKHRPVLPEPTEVIQKDMYKKK